jgi:hypothetical protein
MRAQVGQTAVRKNALELKREETDAALVQIQSPDSSNHSLPHWLRRAVSL